MRASIERLQVLEEVQRELAALRAEVAGLIPLVEQRRKALEKLRPCAHACVPPCPHSRRWGEVTEGLL